jgi:hypothetical protein
MHPLHAFNKSTVFYNCKLFINCFLFEYFHIRNREITKRTRNTPDKTEKTEKQIRVVRVAEGIREIRILGKGGNEIGSKQSAVNSMKWISVPSILKLCYELFNKYLKAGITSISKPSFFIKSVLAKVTMVALY